MRNNTIKLADISASPQSALDNEWETDGFRHVGKAFAQYIQAEDRLLAIGNRNRIDISGIPSTPLQALDFDDRKELEVSKSFQNIFGQELALDRGAGSVVNLHVGTRPNPSVCGGLYSPNYSSEIRKLLDMDNEGDGFKAASGLLLNLIGLPI